jgi:glyoxylase-like metal-dependent hydrolase (beta-lactamase superfamily II)
VAEALVSAGAVEWDTWREVGDGVLVRRHRTLDVNAGLVLGDDRCLVVDTRGCDPEARDLLAAVRNVTPLPFVVATTHAHFDHCFGNAVFAEAQAGCDIWGHERCRTDLLERGEGQRTAMVDWLQACGEEALAAAVAEVAIVPPNRTFADAVAVDLGGRRVTLHHPGRGHTDHDVVVEVVGAGVTFAGDLVEQGAPPSFDDAYPLEWPATLKGLLPRLGAAVVPGHGAVVDPDFVVSQLADIAEVGDAAAALPRDADDDAVERAASRLAVGGPAGYLGLRRALAHLRGPAGR